MDDDIEDNADTGVLDPEDTLEDGDPYDEGYSPPERPLEVDEFGTTPEEGREGESWEGRLARELPDVQPEEGDDLGDTEDTDGELIDDELGEFRAGRLVAADEGSGEDTDEELYASDVGIDGGAASAEEAAVHVVDDPEDY
ncbi:DUF5709 domain-containing protein [Amycolatopsis sp. FDAARGOS 1241]|uniref:DUF5709 domain-containing protein n=1 Tax=Amycolatopsis sp. FDAARGOS 1241 TaxID=2778070 RepID=UPI001950B17F|nr:DUF5709 domain-containing protein [Amycolatopsis sp. FDAARGOS 1241]QRP47800.1 hypothetical protein I6J71_07735 [Amycolatopsis sp. FDAARGOS 1241]